MRPRKFPETAGHSQALTAIERRVRHWRRRSCRERVATLDAPEMAEKAPAMLTETLAFRQIIQDPLVVHKPARCLMSPVFTRGARSDAGSRFDKMWGRPRVDIRFQSPVAQPPRQCRDDVRARRPGPCVRRRSRDRLWPGGADSHETERRGRRRRAGRADAGDASTELKRRPGRLRVYVQWSD